MTPGPWVGVDRVFEDDRYYIVPRSAFEADAVRFKFFRTEDQIASLYVPVAKHPERDHKSDAALIAAAPDLYEALREALSYVEAMPLAGQLYQWLTLPDIIRAALAKAEGRTVKP